MMLLIQVLQERLVLTTSSICGRVVIHTKKKQDYVANKKRKKTSDDNFNVTSKLVAYATQKGKVVFMLNNLV